MKNREQAKRPSNLQTTTQSQNQAVPLLSKSKVHTLNQIRQNENARPRTPTMQNKSHFKVDSYISSSQRKIEKPLKSLNADSEFENEMEKSTSRAVTAKTIKQIKDKKTDIIPNNDFSENDLDINFDQDGDRLLDSLREGCRKQYDPTKLNDHFANILNNPRRKEAQTFMPKEKCQTKKDGRRFMQVGGTEIFYNDSVVEDIINFGVRCRVSAMCHAN